MEKKIKIPKSFISKIQKSRKIFLFAYQSEEADDICALFSLQEALVHLGIKIETWLPKPMPQSLNQLFPAKFLKNIKILGAESEKSTGTQSTTATKTAEGALLIILGNPKGMEGYVSRFPIFNQVQTAAIFYRTPMINGNYYTMPNSTTFCEMTYLLFQKAGWKVTPMIAKALYSGIISKTEGLQKRRTTSLTHEIVAALLEKGTFFANDIYHSLFEKKTPAYLDFLKYIIKNTRLLHKNQVLLVKLNKSQIKDSLDSKFIKDAANFLFMSLSFRMVIFTIYERGQLKIIIFSRIPALKNKFAQGWLVMNQENSNVFGIKGTSSQTMKTLMERLSDIFEN